MSSYHDLSKGASYWQHLRGTNMAALAALLALVLPCCVTAARADSSEAADKPDSPIVAKCKQDLAQRKEIQAHDIEVIDVQPVSWPSSALGMPVVDKDYAQVVTPGSRVTLQARGMSYLYTTSDTKFRYGGPTYAWEASMLFLKPVENEPNLNGDLYQCSLMGTNGFLVMSGVSDYYPQANGTVIVKRRTSRSGHDLLYVKVGDAAHAVRLHSALDFGSAALNDSQDTWAGFVRAALGSGWSVVVAPVSQAEAKKQDIALPEGARPDRIAWEGDTLMVLVKQEDKTVCYSTSPKEAAPKWQAVAIHTFPGMLDYVLNKSESLEIEQVEEDGKPAIEVARIWFTGDRNVVARISGVKLRSYDLLGRYAFIVGQHDSTPVTYTVDIGTGETIRGYTAGGTNIKPLLYPPHSSPLKQTESWTASVRPEKSSIRSKERGPSISS